MKYLRFQGLRPNPGTASKSGIFQLAYDLKYRPFTTSYDDADLRRQLGWLETHLDAPDILDQPDHFRAICWFKDRAHAPLQCVWSLKRILESYGYWIDVVKTWHPGQIIYEDGWQVAAKPQRR